MKKVIIIDDENDILDVLSRFLNRSGKLDIEVFNNPIHGLNKVKEGGVDLVLLDIMMPQMDGLEVLSSIKDAKPDTEVIMMTAFTTLERTIEAHKLGAKNYLTKPFDSLRDVQDKVFKTLNIS